MISHTHLHGHQKPQPTSTAQSKHLCNNKESVMMRPLIRSCCNRGKISVNIRKPLGVSTYIKKGKAKCYDRMNDNSAEA